MPLEILAPLVIFGVALAVVVVHLTGGSKGVHLESATAAITAFNADFPDPEISEVRFANDARAAILLPKSPEPEVVIGLILVMGGRLVTRRLVSGDVHCIKRRNKRLDVRFADFTLAKRKFDFDDEADAQEAESWLASAIRQS